MYVQVPVNCMSSTQGACLECVATGYVNAEYSIDMSPFVELLGHFLESEPVQSAPAQCTCLGQAF